jgi:hypothetical protein
MRSELIGSSLLVSVLALACSDSPPAPSNPRPLPPTEFALSGHVSDFNTGAPLSGATITIIDGANAGRATMSGADGTYVFGMGPGGFTMRVRSDGYDSVFQGVTFVADTRVDIQMRRAMQSLAGTWTGTLSFVEVSTGLRTDATIPALVMTHAGSVISSTFRTSGPYDGSFDGTLRDPASIAATTDTAGTMTTTFNLAGRGPLTCRGTGSFTGTINWTHAVMTAPQMSLDCGIALTGVTIAIDRQQ